MSTPAICPKHPLKQGHELDLHEAHLRTGRRICIYCDTPEIEWASSVPAPEPPRVTVDPKVDTCGSTQRGIDEGRLILAGSPAEATRDERCNACGEAMQKPSPDSIAGWSEPFCTNKQCSRHGRPNDYPAARSSSEPPPSKVDLTRAFKKGDRVRHCAYAVDGTVLADEVAGERVTVQVDGYECSDSFWGANLTRLSASEPPRETAGEVAVPKYPGGTITYRHDGRGWLVYDDEGFRGSLISHTDHVWLHARFGEALAALRAAQDASHRKQLLLEQLNDENDRQNREIESRGSRIEELTRQRDEAWGGFEKLVGERDSARSSLVKAREEIAAKITEPRPSANHLTIAGAAERAYDNAMREALRLIDAALDRSASPADPQPNSPRALPEHQDTP